MLSKSPVFFLFNLLILLNYLRYAFGILRLTSYLMGLLDEFLEQGMVPIVQSMRGCPYQCTFCVSGAMDWNKLRAYPLEQVYQEIEYIRERSPLKYLILTDENWGVLRERDLELAKFITDLNQQYGYPARLYYYTAKVVNESVLKLAKMVAPIAWIGEFCMSYQTLNAEARKTIKRRNTKLDKVQEHTKWAKENDIETVSELIYGFPHETPATIMEGVETLMAKGIDRIVVYPLQLFPGIDLYSKKSRKENGFVTQFRAAESGLGTYQNGELVSIEVEEVVVETKWSNFEDFLVFRKYGFFLQMLLGRAYFHELIQIGNLAGFQMTKLVRHLTLNPWSENSNMWTLLRNYTEQARNELHATPELVYQELKQKIVAGENIGGLKLNLVYLGKIMSDPKAINETLVAIKEFIDSEADKEALDKTPIIRYINEILPNKILPIEPKCERVIEFSSTFDYKKWSNRSFKKLQELLLDSPVELEGEIDESTESILKSIDIQNPASLQAYYDRLSNEEIVRKIVQQ